MVSDAPKPPWRVSRASASYIKRQSEKRPDDFFDPRDFIAHAGDTNQNGYDRNRKKDKNPSKVLIDKALVLEADESGRKFELVFEKIIPRKKRKREDKPTGKPDRSKERVS